MAHKIPLSDARKYVLNGYLCLLRDAPPNGRCIHNIKQKMTALQLNLSLGSDIRPEYEAEIKKLIHDLYPNMLDTPSKF